MAIYYTMGVDCGADPSLADRIVRQFDGMTIALPKIPPVVCKAGAEERRGLWFVCVYPCGMGYGTIPVSEQRRELVSDGNQAIIREQLYATLRTVPGFRRAMFGGECFDQMAYADSAEDSDIDYGMMISSVACFPNDPANCRVEQFTEGYRIVLRRRTPES